MRKITLRTAKAFAEGRRLTCGNTTVAYYEREQVSSMYLHGNLIALWDRRTHTFITTLAGWNMPTTRERLNGLLTIMREAGHIKSFAGYSQKAFAPIFNDLEISPNEWQEHGLIRQRIAA